MCVSKMWVIETFFSARERDIFVHIHRRIEHGRHSVAVVAHEIGELGDSFSLDAFKYEGHGWMGLRIV